MDPGTAILAAQAISAAIQGGSAGLGAASAHKEKKKLSKQFKKQTFADLISQALSLDVDRQAMNRQAQDQYADQRAANFAGTGRSFARGL